MAGSKHTTPGEQAREAYRLARRERLARQPDPYVKPTITGGLDPIPGDDRTLWPRTLWGTDLAVLVPAWTPPPIQFDRITLMLGDEELLERELVDPDNDPEEFKFSIPAATIADERTYELLYRVYRSSVGNDLLSLPLMLSVDHTPPNQGVPDIAPTLPQEIIDNGLRLDYLNTHPTVPVTVPRSSDITAGDVIQVFWGRVNTPPGLPVASRPVTQAEAAPSPGAPLVVEIDSNVIKTLPDGDIGILYRYVDRTGNLGQPSAWTAIYVDLDPLPANLVDPEVPLAEVDGVIDRADAQLGVTVLIPAPGYDNGKPGDRIQAIWEGIEVAPTQDVDVFPLEIPIRWSILSAGGYNDQRPIKVSYRILRGPTPIPSNEIDLSVDFTVAGPDPDPVDPGPIHPALPLVVIKSRETIPVDNVLGEADKNQPAVAVIPTNPVLKDEVLRLYWGALKDPVDEVTIDMETPTDPITFSVPWDKIVEGDYNEKLPVYYSTWNGVNEQESLITEVDVRIIDVIGLGEVEFPDRWKPEPPIPIPPVAIINCCSLPWNGIKFQMAGDAVNFDDGDQIVVSWQAFDDWDGTSEIANTDHVFAPVTIDQTIIDDGFELTVPYAAFVEPIVTDGSGRVTCVLTKLNGKTGSSVTLVRVSRWGGGTVLCTIDAPGNCD